MVRHGEDPQRKIIDVYSPKGARKVRVTYPKDQQVRIESTLAKRLELEHIEDTMEALSVLPDFGFEPLFMDGGDEGSVFKGWDLLRDFMQSGGKYERLHNYVEMRQ